MIRHTIGNLYTKFAPNDHSQLPPWPSLQSGACFSHSRWEDIWGPVWVDSKKSGCKHSRRSSDVDISFHFSRAIPRGGIAGLHGKYRILLMNNTLRVARC